MHVLRYYAKYMHEKSCAYKQAFTVIESNKTDVLL